MCHLTELIGKLGRTMNEMAAGNTSRPPHQGNLIAPLLDNHQPSREGHYLRHYYKRHYCCPHRHAGTLLPPQHTNPKFLPFLCIILSSIPGPSINLARPMSPWREIHLYERTFGDNIFIADSPYLEDCFLQLFHIIFKPVQGFP